MVSDMSQKKRVLVTGASRGLGRAIALRLADAGFEVSVNARSQSEALVSLKAELEAKNAMGSELIFDVADRTLSQEVLLADIEANGAFWGIVSNAGITKDGAFPALTAEDWTSVIDVDLNGFFNVVHPCVMPMIGLRDGGRIIAVSSVSGIVGNRGQTNYSAAKAGLIGATKALAVELGKRRITVNSIAPGLIDTEMVQMNETALRMAMDSIPLRRMGKPEEVAALTAFLMSDEASYITRQVISINGGMV